MFWYSFWVILNETLSWFYKFSQQVLKYEDYVRYKTHTQHAVPQTRLGLANTMAYKRYRSEALAFVWSCDKLRDPTFIFLKLEHKQNWCHRRSWTKNYSAPLTHHVDVNGRHFSVNNHRPIATAVWNLSQSRQLHRMSWTHSVKRSSPWLTSGGSFRKKCF